MKIYFIIYKQNQEKALTKQNTNKVVIQQVDVDSNDCDDETDSETEEIETEELVTKELEKEELKTQEDEKLNVRSKRNVKCPGKFDDYELYMAFDAMSFVENVPNDYNELENRRDKNLWEEAINREIESITKVNTWKSVIKPKDVEILDTKWVYTYKPLEKDKLNQYKARLVVSGFAQKETFNYDELFSPVAKMSTIRTLLAIENQLKYNFVQLDVKAAFLHGNLKEDIYIYPPNGIECKNGCVFKLNKSLYGLRQSSKCWNSKFNEFLLSLNFQRSNNDYCLYFKKDEVVYILIYVDDIILASPNLRYIEFYKEKLTQNFNIKDKGELKNFLELEIDYDKRCIKNKSKQIYFENFKKIQF